MMRYDIGDYIEEGYTSQGHFIPDELYAEVLDSVVFACVDIFVVTEEGVLLGKRSRHPQADWFMFGGRMRTGESLTGSARRTMSVETGLQIEEDRFKYLTSWSGAWRKRAFPPEDNGSHNVSITMLLELSQAEVAALQLNDEYSEHKQCSVDELLSDESYHPALRQCALAWKHSKGLIA